MDQYTDNLGELFKTYNEMKLNGVRDMSRILI